MILLGALQAASITLILKVTAAPYAYFFDPLHVVR
jgi:hypothetical protein